MITIDLELVGDPREKISKIEGFVDKRLQDIVDAAASLAVQIYQENAPFKTGEFQSSIGTVEHGHHFVTIGPNEAEQLLGKWLVGGVAPHPIFPLSARALRFEKGGEIIFRKFVMHTGISPMDFKRITVEQLLDVLRNLPEITNLNVSESGEPTAEPIGAL